MTARRHVLIDGKRISRSWLEQHPKAYPGLDRETLKPAPVVVTATDPLITRIDLVMQEASRISGAIGKQHGSHPAMFAMNRAWHSMGTARDGLLANK